MKTQAAWVLAAALSTGAVAQTYAQGTNTTTGARHKPGGPMAELSFDKMDAKGDGKVTLDEFQAAFAVMLKDRFTAMDTNGDGVLSKEEVEAARAAHRPQGQHGKRGDGATPPAANAAQK